MKVVSATSPGHVDRPNEDFVGDVPGAVVLLDGAGIPGSEAICRHGVAWHSHALGVTLLGRLAREGGTELVGALADSIDEVAGHHRHTCDIANPSSPQSTVVISDSRTIAQTSWCSRTCTWFSTWSRPGRTWSPTPAGSACAANARSPCTACPRARSSTSRSLQSAIDALRSRRSQPGGYWFAKTIHMRPRRPALAACLSGG